MFLRNWARLYSKQTAPETKLEREIALLGKPYRAQHPFFGLCRIVDFALIEDRIVIEVDGASHDKPAQRRKDVTSTIALEKQGWKVVRLRNEEVMDDPAAALRTAFDRLSNRPTLRELELALQDLPPAPPKKPSKRRGHRRAPVPK